MSEQKNELITNIKDQLNEKNIKKQEFIKMINAIDNEIEDIKGKYLKKILETKIPQNSLLKISNIQIKNTQFNTEQLIEPLEWKFSYEHNGHLNEKLYEYKKYCFIESTIDVEDDSDDEYDDKLNNEYNNILNNDTNKDSQLEIKDKLINTHVELICIKKNKYIIKVNGERSRFSIFVMNGVLVIHNQDYKFDLSQRAQQELIKNYIYVDEIPEAVALSVLLLIIEKGWSIIDELREIFEI